MSPPPEKDCLDQMKSKGNSSLVDAVPGKVVETWGISRPDRAQHSQESFIGSEDAWFLKQSDLDSSILKQGFQRQLSSKRELSSSSEHITISSLAENLGRCKYIDAYSNIGTSFYQVDQNSAGVRALQSGSCHQFIDSNITSTPDRLSQPGSPFNNSCASNKMSIVANDVRDCVPNLFAEIERFPIQASSVIPQDSDLALGSRGMTESGSHSPWAKTTSESQATLSAHASVGAGTTKVSKRRSRASAKPPITVLSADTSNFRAMVQKLTGIPASPPMQPGRFHFWDASTMASILKPHPSRPAESIPGLPTLDTSTFFLLDGGSSINQNAALFQSDSVLQGFPQVLNNSSLSGSLDVHLDVTRGGQHNPYNSAFMSNPDVKTLFPNLIDTIKHPRDPCVSLPMLSDSGESGSLKDLNDRLREKCLAESFMVDSLRKKLSNQLLGRQECSHDRVNSNMDLNKGMSGDKADYEQFNLRQAANLENFLMGNDNFGYRTRTPYSVDTWLSCDGENASAMELEHSA